MVFNSILTLEVAAGGLRRRIANSKPHGFQDQLPIGCAMKLSTTPHLLPFPPLLGLLFLYFILSAS